MRLRSWVVISMFLALVLAAAYEVYFQPAFQQGKLAKTTNAHYSIFSRKDFFETAFAAAPISPAAPTGQVEGLLVNHHLLAPHFIAQVFAAAASDKPLTVVLISPNHFGIGGGPVLASRLSWETPYGELKPASGAIGALVASGLVKVEEPPFDNEHGIRNLVAFLKRELPNAKIVPLIIKDNLPARAADALAGTLSELSENVLFVGSFDFSHYQNLEVANRHDEASLAAVKNLDWQNTAGLDTDSPAGLRVFLEALARRGASRFRLLQHSNSAIIANEPNATSTTSYIIGDFSSD